MDEKHRVNRREYTERNWLVLQYKDNPIIRLDTCLLDRIVASDAELMMTAGDVVAVLPVLPTEDSNVANQLATELAPYIRSSPISEIETYANAIRRLETRTDPPSLFYATDAVRASDEHLFIGTFVCHISDARRYAYVGASLPLDDGYIQAALAMLVVGARERAEDFDQLASKIAAYEANRPKL